MVKAENQLFYGTQTKKLSMGSLVYHFIFTSFFKLKFYREILIFKIKHVSALNKARVVFATMATILLHFCNKHTYFRLQLLYNMAYLIYNAYILWLISVLKYNRTAYFERFVSFYYSHFSMLNSFNSCPHGPFNKSPTSSRLLPHLPSFSFNFFFTFLFPYKSIVTF